ncbi:MAG TPA: sigma-54 dependent transcriptional regulator [Polyangiaceae bacterium]|nr:sigma-54 dependent transcriptional regulator [Polyangiaceae bacterium]
MTNRVLLVDDDSDFCSFAELTLRACGFEAESRPTATQALEALGQADFDVVLVDVNLAGTSGLDLCGQIAQRWENLPVVVMTASGTMEVAVAAIRAGAYDFVTKPLDQAVLQVALERAVRHRSVNNEVGRLRRAVRDPSTFEEIVGASAAMRRVFDLIERAAEVDASVLITGESGTGKELVARALHRRSPRSGGPFIALSCAALPETLLESELFGYVKGAFTDARGSRSGLLAQASGGTLFLDEIGDMSAALQPKLLRALQERTVRPVGGTDEIPFDARVIAATNRDLDAAVSSGGFRRDLFFRINVVGIHLPPLRARGEDVLLIAQALLKRHATLQGRPVPALSSAVTRRFLSYSWPGNVRELANCIERGVALGRGPELTLDDLPETIREPAGESPSDAVTVSPLNLVSLEEVERGYVLRVLEAVGGNKTLAAKILGVDRKTLYRKLQNLDAPPAPATTVRPTSDDN